MPELIQRIPNLKIAFIGHYDKPSKKNSKKKSKYYRQLRSNLFQKKLFRRVIWAGRRNNIHELVQGLDACIVPSLKEPLGLCALEAMAAGVPVAAARVGGLKEIVLHEQTGLQFDPRQATEMADSIERILIDQPLRERIISQSRQMLKQQFSPAAVTTQIESALQSVIQPKIETAVASST